MSPGLASHSVKVNINDGQTLILQLLTVFSIPLLPPSQTLYFTNSRHHTLIGQLIEFISSREERNDEKYI